MLVDGIVIYYCYMQLSENPVLIETIIFCLCMCVYCSTGKLRM
jgi:hypothetical protein